MTGEPGEGERTVVRGEGERTVVRGEGEWTVVRGAASGFAQQIASGPHALSADEPAVAGGSDTGPSPYDLLLAALGACTSMTVSLYARRRGLALREVVVRLRHSKIHARDCADCETRVGMLDRIEREIELLGELSAGERDKLFEIADKCPVHRTLSSEVVIETRPYGAQQGH